MISRILGNLLLLHQFCKLYKRRLENFRFTEIMTMEDTVQIPFIDSIITPPLAEEYIEEFYSVKRKDGQSMTVYVNRGLGTTRVPFRFFAKPEIIIFTLQHG